MARRTGYDVDADGQIDKTPGPERPFRSEKAERGKERGDLAQRLVDLRDLSVVELDAQLREAVLHAKSISQPKARARQMKYIARLLRGADVEAIEETLGGDGPLTPEQEAHFARLERWRSKMIDDDGAIDAFVQDFPEADRQRLRQEVRAVRKALGTDREARARKQLYQLLRRESEGA